MFHWGLLHLKQLSAHYHKTSLKGVNQLVLVVPVQVLVVFTTIVIVFDVAGLPVKQGVAFDVISQVTKSLFDKAEIV